MDLASALCVAIATLGLSKTTEKTACRYMPEVVKQSKAKNIDPVLITSMMFVESGYQKNVVSHAGACGLMQLIPKWNYSVVNGKRKYYTCEQLKRNTRLNIRLGVLALQKWMKIIEDDNPKNTKVDILNRSICAYNAGNRCRWKSRVKDPRKTRYVKAVRKTQGKILRSLKVTGN